MEEGTQDAITMSAPHSHPQPLGRDLYLRSHHPPTVVRLVALLLVWVWLGKEAAHAQVTDLGLYQCRESPSQICNTFLLYRASSGYADASTVATLFSSRAGDIAAMSNVAENQLLPSGQPLLVPISCGCFNGSFMANISYTIRAGDYFDMLRLETFERLTTIGALVNFNKVDPQNLTIGQEVTIPLLCSCPSQPQRGQGTTALVTYPVVGGDTLKEMSDSFGVPENEIQAANQLPNDQLQANTTLLVPIATAFPSFDPQSGGKSSNTGAIVGAVVGAVVVATLVGLGLWWFYRRRRLEGIQGNPKGGIKLKLASRDDTKQAVSYSLRELKVATNHFRQKIGEGSFGPVYYGRLPKGKEIAVKVNRAESKQGVEEFVNEVVLLSRVHYKHLVSLIGYCDSSNQRILIYEYMQNGTLRDHLSVERATKVPLDMGTRLKIAIGAAKGLEYMHKGCNPKIVHRDVKSTNILLDKHLVAKVADFGISKSSLEDVSGFTTVVKGTPGYLDPEYFSTHRLTEKSDVYSFGIVLLEIMTGRHPMALSVLHDGTEGGLKEWARSAVEDDNIDAIIDPALGGAYNKEASGIVVHLALACTQSRPANRPDMTQIASGLVEALELESPSLVALVMDHKSVSDLGSKAKININGSPTGDRLPLSDSTSLLQLASESYGPIEPELDPR